MVRRNSQPYAQDFLRAHGIDNGLHAIVSGGGATLAYANQAERKVQFVINHDQVLLRIHLVLPRELLHRQSAQVHIRFRLGQQNFFFANPGPRSERLAVPVVYGHAALFGNPVNSQKADIVRRELVFDTGIAQPDDQLHASYFLASAGSSVSCLPFLMTSGSAGATVASAAAASGVATTSSLTEVVWATAWFSSVMNLIEPMWGRSATRSTCPKTSSLMSASMLLGMSPGKHSISTSRITWSRMPPCCFTPAASPLR